MEKVVVIGGSGFVGQVVLGLLKKQKYEIVSLSRHGKPENCSPELDDIRWVKADLFQDTSWRILVEEADYVIDLLGILFEKPRQQITYQKYIVESAQLIARITAETPVKRIIFLSATAGIPVVGQNYIQAKRKAEKEFQQGVTPVTIIRSSLIYGKSKRYSTIQSLPLRVINKIPILKKAFVQFEPTTVETVAKMIVISLKDLEKIVVKSTIIKKL